MNSGLLKLLYTNAFNDIEAARNCQIAISQKEMEIQMININSSYSSYDNIYIGRLRKQSLEQEITNIKNIRNNHINSAISYALTIAENEIQENNSFSVAAIVIGSITSFISSVKESYSISVINRTNISLLSSKLLLSGIHMLQLKNALQNLALACNIL